MKVHKGQTLGIVGESGCGKSSLSRILVGISEPTEGALKVGGMDIGTLTGADRRQVMQKVQMVFQSPFSSLDPRMTVEQIVREPLDVNRKDLPLAVRKQKARDMLEHVGLNKAIPSRYPHQLSGGQQQRVGIARALVSEPDVVICDEPVSALDVSVQAQVINLLRELQQESGVAYVFVSHDLAVVANISDTIAVMYLGKIVEYGKCEDVLTQPRHPYTIALVDSSGEPDPTYEKNRELHLLKGELPKPTDPPSGCPFRTRCWKVRDECAREAPRLMQHEGASQAVACHFP
ncbi:oligopeptide/dipeptide ABC transporter ATP-binding protein [Pokkaliibacter plantistimulans]|uniref:ABC transporter ATP-binding protein n=1 Tax=Pokkaliibacter plantistimulans TaxID=1635171 RepID=UPI002D77941F|nr:oligopeptide/dipeptide ABC transporter ATP-binding protein [Pokkaliibacter plantistimulans]